MGAGERGASDGVGESFRLGFVCRRSGKCSTGFSRGAGIREKVDFIANSAAEIDKRFADVGWVVVGFVCVLRTGSGECQGHETLEASLAGRNIGNVRYLKKFLVNLLQSVDTFFELDVVSWKLGLERWFDCVS